MFEGGHCIARFQLQHDLESVKSKTLSHRLNAILKEVSAVIKLAVE
jgi:hypothetical protein